jgi:hypothetical protein
VGHNFEQGCRTCVAIEAVCLNIAGNSGGQRFFSLPGPIDHLSLVFGPGVRRVLKISFDVQSGEMRRT